MSFDSSRQKSEKFGILDSPALRATDLRQPPGPRGRALLYLDIDLFKQVNAKHTETLIDRTLLPAYQKLVRDIVEPYGHVYAEGGDEVVVLLNNWSAFLACALAEEIRFTVERTTFHVANDSVSITISAGVAHSGDHDSGSDLQLKANEAKNFSKNVGRNRSSIALRTTIESLRMLYPVLQESVRPVISPFRLKEMVEEPSTACLVA